MSLAAERHAVVTDKAPRPLAGAPYSQAIASRGLVFCSGQVPLDPETQQLVEGGIAEQTERVLENLKGVLEAAGSTLADVVKTTVFMMDLGQFAAIDQRAGVWSALRAVGKFPGETCRRTRDAMCWRAERPPRWRRGCCTRRRSFPAAR